MVGTPKTPPSKHKTFGISDSLLDAVKEVYRPKDKEDAKEAYIRPGRKERERTQARKSDTLKSKDSVSSAGTTAFKKKHAGKTVPKRAAGAPVPKSTGQSGDKRPVGGMGAVYHDLSSMPEDEFRRKHGKSKSAMRTGLRDHVEIQKEEKEMTFRQSDYEYNRDSWMKSLSQVGKDGVQEEEITEMNITVEMNPGGTTYKVLSVSKDVGGRIKVGENLTDTHIDDLRDSDVSISYKGGKGGMKKMEAKEAKDVDADSAAAARRHDCASHVKSEEFGEGVCIPTQHADPDDNGQVDWYDVMFDHGIERVMTETVAIVKSSSHMHSSKMKKKKAIMGSKMEEKDVMKHNCATHVKHEEFGEGNPIPGQHTLEETTEGNGIVTHYDVMFEEGIKENVPVEELEIISEMSHGHSKKKKSVKSGYMMSSKKMNEYGSMMSSKKMKMKKEKLDPVGQADADIDNDGDTDDSDEYLHKRRKAIKKAIKKEGVNENFTAPGKEQPKDAAQAFKLAEHYLQLANRDALFGREDKQKVNEGLAKAFYASYKQMVADGDESSNDLFKNEEVEAKLESFSESEISQTNEERPNMAARDREYRRVGMGHLKKQNDADKAAGMIKMVRDRPGDSYASATVPASKEAEYRKRGYTKGKIGEDATPAQIETQRLAKIKDKKEKEKTKMMGKTHFQGVNDRRNAPKAGGVQNEDLKAVEYEGEIIYEGFDSSNMPEHAPEVVEHTPDAYSFNRNAWSNALAEVNRYKTGGTGHRVTQVDKSGDEHIVMQLRKAVSMRDAHTGVKFKDGETHKISAKTAQKHLDHYSQLKPEDKIKWQNSASHSHGGLSSASGDKKKGQVKPSSGSGRDEPTRRLINPMDRN